MVLTQLKLLKATVNLWFSVFRWIKKGTIDLIFVNIPSRHKKVCFNFLINSAPRTRVSIVDFGKVLPTSRDVAQNLADQTSVMESSVTLVNC